MLSHSGIESVTVGDKFSNSSNILLQRGLSNTAADRIAAPSSASATIGREKKERRRRAGSGEAATCESVGRRLPLTSPPPLLEDLFSQDGDREQEEIDRVTYITHPGDRALWLVNSVESVCNCGSVEKVRGQTGCLRR